MSPPAAATVMFYHLTRSPSAAVLRGLLGRVPADWRVLIRAAGPELAALDAALWQGDATTFLPHALAGGPQDCDQPIVLGNGPALGFNALALVSITDLDIAEAAHLQRIWVMFEDSDSAQMATARALWQVISRAGLHAQYWSEESGKWVKKTAANAPTSA